MGYCKKCGNYGLGRFCENCGAPFIEGGIRLEYSTTGMMRDGGFTYKLWEEGEVGKLLVRKPGVSINHAPVFDVDKSFISRVKLTMDAAKCESWNGFNGHMQGVMDGTNYYFSYTDGKDVNVHWSGYMAMPESFYGVDLVLKAMFDEVYDEFYPNFYKKIGQFLDETIKPEYGVSRQGNSIVFYKHVCDNTFERVDWDIPSGCLFANVGKFSQYETAAFGIPGFPMPAEQKNAEKRQWAEAFTVFLEPVKADGKDCTGSHVRLIFRWYEADKEGIRMTGEVSPTNDIIDADSGYSFVFSYVHEDTTYFGFFSRLFFAYGKDCIDYTLLLFGFKDGKWQWIDGIHNRSDINDISGEDLKDFVEFARKYGMGKLADKWEKGGVLNMNLLDYNIMIHFKWSNNIDNDFAKKLEEVPDGELVPGYDIKVETAVYKCYFPM